MIYQFIDEQQPIRQGDIFIGVPRIELSLKNIPVVDEKQSYNLSWDEVYSQIRLSDNKVKVIASIRPVSGIVITQDCDALRANDITLCEIRNFELVEGKVKSANNPNAYQRIITQHSKVNLKWFYLPPDDIMGFDRKMGVDFTVTIRISREDLQNNIKLRVGRLSILAYDHFRERLSEFFRRYSYNEWYPLDKEEFDAYYKEHKSNDIMPFKWQE